MYIRVKQGRDMRILMPIIALLIAITASAQENKTSRSVYIDIMEEAVTAYSPERIRDYIQRVDRDGITEHGYARLTANLGILISQGRLQDKKDLFIKMMDICVKELPVAFINNKDKGEIGNEFAVKEIVCCILETERSGLFPKEKTDAWREALKDMAPSDIYRVRPAPGDTIARNWCVFGAASECARLMAGIGGDRSYADLYLADQLRFFDGNGMYRDPHSPMVYDFVTRLQYMFALYCGYDGPAKEAIEEQLLRSAIPTLMMQSVTGEIPYGGRSNQFLHNDTFYMAVCEYYATWMKERGDLELAGKFKAAALLTLSDLRYWMSEKPVRHIKNRYPTETGYGCEGYAYFDKYMVTAASWAYLAWLFADDTIIPVDNKDRVSTFATSPDFHRVIMNAGGYTIQFDINAQEEYDSNGIGRIQKKGAPPAIGLTSPCPAVKKPNYKIDVVNEGPLALAPLWENYKLLKAEKRKVELTDVNGSKWICRLSRKGLRMTLKGNGEQVLSIPALIYDGETKRTPLLQGKQLAIRNEGWECRYTSNAVILDTGKIFGSRNGRLKEYKTTSNHRLRVKVIIREVPAAT